MHDFMHKSKVLEKDIIKPVEFNSKIVNMSWIIKRNARFLLAFFLISVIINICSA